MGKRTHTPAIGDFFNFFNNLQTSFTLDKRSRRNCMRTIGRSFRTFKNYLTVNHIIPFKDEPEMLKKPPAEYSFIEDEDWNIFVKDRLSNAFQVKPLNHATSINM